MDSGMPDVIVIGLCKEKMQEAKSQQNQFLKKYCEESTLHFWFHPDARTAIRSNQTEELRKCVLHQGGNMPI